MLAIRTHARPKNRRVSVDIPPEYPQGLYEVVLLPIETEGKPEGASRYDFSDLSGRLKWKGDAVAVQRTLRDEW